MATTRNDADEPAVDDSDRDDHLHEIERSLGAIWQRRTGVRPISISAELRGNAIRCAIERGKEDPELSVDDEGRGDSYSYRHESIAAVTKITHRSVAAFINTEDPKTGNAEQTFIFERLRTRY
jgi:hypothetical protein